MLDDDPGAHVLRDRLEAVEALPYLYPLLQDNQQQVRQAARTAIENLEAVAESDRDEPLRAG